MHFVTFQYYYKCNDINDDGFLHTYFSQIPALSQVPQCKERPCYHNPNYHPTHGAYTSQLKSNFSVSNKQKSSVFHSITYQRLQR